MTDINTALETAYYAALKDLTTHVYNGQLPDNVNPEEYIIFRSIQNNDASTQNSSDTSTNITVEIHTNKNKINETNGGNSLAAQVFAAIYPNPQFNLTLSSMQMTDTKLINDRTDEYQMSSQLCYISRYLTFNHLIYIP